MSYLSHEKRVKKKFINDLYKEIKDQVREELWDVPLREFTYDKKRSFVDKNGNFFIPQRNLVFQLDQYIHSYKVKLPMDVSLKDAINLI